MPKKKTSVRSPGVIEQLRVASNNPAALLIGCLFGGFIPLATYWISHRELDVSGSVWQPAWAMVAGGLVYSAKTVFQWARLTFQDAWKATGFVVLIEGVMVTSHTPWLSVAALAYLMTINAVATGCQLTQGDRGKGKKRRRRRPRRARTPEPVQLPAAKAAA